MLGTFRGSSFGVAILDRRLSYVGVNEALASMNGIPAAKHEDKQLADVVGKLAAKIGPLIERVFKTGQPISGVIISARLPSRADVGRWVEDYLPLFDHTGRVTSVAVVVCELSRWIQSGRPAQRRPKSETDRINLSPRESQIVRLLAEGKSNKEISSMLKISTKTVESHRSRVLLKLHLKSLVGLVHYAIRTHLVEP